MANKKDTKKVEEKKIEPVAIVLAPKPPVVKPISLPKAFYIEKTAGVWRFIIADVDGEKLVNKKVKDCDNKALSLEYFKIAFAKVYYFGQ